MPMPIRVYTVYVSALISTAIRFRTRAVLVNLLRWKYFVLFHLRWHRYSENRFCRNDIKYFHKRRLAAARVKGSVRNVQKLACGGKGVRENVDDVGEWLFVSLSLFRLKSSWIQSFERVFTWMDEQSIGSYVDRERRSLFMVLYGRLGHSPNGK